MKIVLKVGSKYVGKDQINFGYTTLVDSIKDAKVFNSVDEANSYSELLYFHCEIEFI